MAVQKDRVTRSRRGMRRSHDALTAASLTTDSLTGETHRRHHATKTGFYRGKKIVGAVKEAHVSDDTESE